MISKSTFSFILRVSFSFSLQQREVLVANAADSEERTAFAAVNEYLHAAEIGCLDSDFSTDIEVVVAILDLDVLVRREPADRKVPDGDVEPGEDLVVLEALNAGLQHVKHAEVQALHLDLRLLTQLHHQRGHCFYEFQRPNRHHREIYALLQLVDTHAVLLLGRGQEELYEPGNHVDDAVLQ